MPHPSADDPDDHSTIYVKDSAGKDVCVGHVATNPSKQKVKLYDESRSYSRLMNLHSQLNRHHTRQRKLQQEAGVRGLVHIGPFGSLDNPGTMFAWACERFFVFADSPVRAYDPACEHRNVICNAAVILLYLHTSDKETCVPMSVALSRASVVQGVNEIIHRSEELFRVSLYERDCKNGCCSASIAAGLFMWFTKSRYWMKSINSGDTFGPGNFSSSSRKVPTLINFVSNLVSGC